VQLVGFVVFYIIPYAFTFGDIPLFLGVLMGILLGMLFGLCVMSALLQPFVERWMLKLLVGWWHRPLETVVVKVSGLVLCCGLVLRLLKEITLFPFWQNLSGHRKRNEKTAQMFTICLAFIIFAGVMFALQARSLGDNVRVRA
jgi:hypothetical protein